jgi:hypothetical protein
VTRRTIVILVLAVLVAGGLVAFVVQRQDDDPFATYCAEVEEQRAVLGQQLAGGPQTGLIAALPTFRDLAAVAPDDIADEWQVVIDHVEALQDALDAAGVDAATYDRDHPPADVTKEQREQIDAAAVALASPTMRAALDGVQQQARDVCRTPLSL